MSVTDIAVATIKGEHRALMTVLHAFQESLSSAAASHSRPEFGLYSAMLYYIDDFQERCHHPKEDEYFFKALGAATAEFDGTIDRLQADHVSSVHAVSRLHRCLVHYQAGAAGGFEALKASVDEYVAQISGHIRCEEYLLDRSLAIISGQNWGRMAAAFDKNDDPLFGSNRRDEFARFYQRIQRLAPHQPKQNHYPASRF